MPKASLIDRQLLQVALRYGGMEVSEAKRLRDIAEENGRLEALVADLTLDNQMFKAVN